MFFPLQFKKANINFISSKQHHVISATNSFPVKGEAQSVLEIKVLARKLVEMLLIDTELVRQERHTF